ncbi:MAG: HEAT repeat domain-containing protein, partial [Planctomycetales bacterium]|nr:HEAT repeat domain-containing protein [Planctomycetales bacterium]
MLLGCPVCAFEFVPAPAAGDPTIWCPRCGCECGTGPAPAAAPAPAPAPADAEPPELSRLAVASLWCGGAGFMVWVIGLGYAESFVATVFGGPKRNGVSGTFALGFTLVLQAGVPILFCFVAVALANIAQGRIERSGGALRGLTAANCGRFLGIVCIWPALSSVFFTTSSSSRVQSYMEGKPLPYLVAELGSGSAEVRAAAASALSDLGAGAAAALPELIRAAKDPDSQVREAVAEALGDIGSPPAVPALTELLADPEEDVRGDAAWALGQIGAPSAPAAKQIASLLQDSDHFVRWRAAVALDQIGPGAAVAAPFLVETALHDPDGDVRGRAGEALRSVGLAAVKAALVERIHVGNYAERLRAVDLLLRLDPRPADQEALVRALRKLLQSPEAVARMRAVTVLRDVGRSFAAVALPDLEGLLQDP